MTSCGSLPLAFIVTGLISGCGGSDLDDLPSEQQLAQTEAALGVDPSTEAASDCDPNYFCAWLNANYQKRRVQFADGGCHNYGGAVGFNDKASSWYNRTSHNVRMYWDTGCTGKSTLTSPGQKSPHMGDWNDEVSSICIGSGC